MYKEVEAKFRTWFCRQCGDEDPYSEAETFSVEETLTMSTTATKKVYLLSVYLTFNFNFARSQNLLQINK